MIEKQDGRGHRPLPAGRHVNWCLGRLNAVLKSWGADAVLGHSYLFALDEHLRRALPGERDVVLREFWAYVVLPQVLDHLESTGFEEEKCKMIQNLISKNPWNGLGISIDMPGGDDESRAFSVRSSNSATLQKGKTHRRGMHLQQRCGRQRWNRVSGQTLSGMLSS